MVNIEDVFNELKKITTELNYVKDGVKDGDNKNTLLRFVDDVQIAIDNATSKFEKYSTEAKSITDDLHDIYNRLNDSNN